MTNATPLNKTVNHPHGSSVPRSVERTLKVLLVGHACSPFLGSEPGFTWNWACHLSSFHDIWVLTHPQFREEIEQYLEDHQELQINFEWLNLPDYRDPWKPLRGERGIRPHYLLWQRAALNKASKLLEREQFDLIHHVSWGTVSAPPSLWKLPVPLVWGPLGGGQTTPSSFIKHFGKSRFNEQLRTLRINMLPFLPPVRRAAKNSEFICATNRETVRVLERAGARDVALVLDAGLPPQIVPKEPPLSRDHDELRVLWAGRIEYRKGLTLALEATARAPRTRLRIAGKGPLMEEGQHHARRLGIEERVEWLGEVSHEDMPSIFEQSDIFLFTSLRDSMGSVVLEAMAHGLPVVALDHQGVGTFVPSDAAIKVPVTDPQTVANALAGAISAFVDHPERHRALGHAAWRWAGRQTWDKRAAQMAARYEDIVRRRQPASVPR
jgi:glycosyltransferase involved in cell wall biosynthesis